MSRAITTDMDGGSSLSQFRMSVLCWMQYTPNFVGRASVAEQELERMPGGRGERIGNGVISGGLRGCVVWHMLAWGGGLRTEWVRGGKVAPRRVGQDC